MTVRFAPGYHDIFHNYSGNFTSETPAQRISDIALTAAKNSGAQVIRVSVNWDNIEHDRPNQGTWASTGGGYLNNYDLGALAGKAAILGLKVLPLIFNAPSWVDRSYCQPTWVGDGNPRHQILYYPSSPSAYAAYAAFVVRVIQFFEGYRLPSPSTATVCDAVEVWNEPNLSDGNLNISLTNPDGTAAPRHFNSMVSATLSQVASSAYSSKTVVSGGLFVGAPDPPPTAGSPWKSYLDTFCEQCGSNFAIGLHTYDFRDFEGSTLSPDEIADQVVLKILSLFDAFDNYLLSVHGISRDLWVTEAGAFSRSPLGQSGQKRALQNIFGHGVGFDTSARSRCKTALVFRLYADTYSSIEEPSSDFRNFSTVHSDWTTKLSYAQLHTEWT